MPSAMLPASVVAAAVSQALLEDLSTIGDVTTDSIIAEGRQGSARLVAREALTIAGLGVAREVFRQVDETVRFEPRVEDGARVQPADHVAVLRGPARGLLRGERVALNFLMRMSGVASATQDAVREVAGTQTRILDTRKTIPGLRRLDKYAVAVGGGTNHRIGLYDEAMIKDTHLEAVESIGHAVADVLRSGLHPSKVTVEVRDLDQLGQAISAGAGRALLDNMTVPQMAQAVRFAAGRIELEASGGLKPGQLRAVAETGVDAMSLGWLTHSAPAADLAMEMDHSG